MADMKRETEVRTARPPLFPLWILFLVAALLEIGLLLWVWPMTVVRGVSWRLVVFSAAIVVTTVYVVGEPIRYRWRITLKVLLMLTTLIAIGCGLFGQRIAQVRQQQRAVREIQTLGGQAGCYIKYDFDEGWGSSVKTRDGWMFPKWMVDMVGKDLFGRVVCVSLDTNRNVDRAVESLGRLAHVEELDLNYCQLSDESLVNLKRLPKLRSLGLRNTSVTDSGVARLAELSELEVLSLTGARVTSAALAHLSNLPRLAYLTLENTDVDDAGLAHLARLDEIKYLNLAGCEITDAGLQQLQHLESLTALDLSDTRVTDEGLKFLVGLQSLSCLRLDGTDVTDAGLEYLTGLPKLSELSLKQTGITDVGAQILPRFRTLRRVYLYGTNVTYNEMLQLMDAVPGCECLK